MHFLLLDCTTVADVCFVIDSSGDINEFTEQFSHLKDSINTLIDRFNVSSDDTHVGAVRFSDSANVMFHLNRHYTQTAAKEAISRMSYIGGSRNTQRGLLASINSDCIFLSVSLQVILICFSFLPTVLFETVFTVFNEDIIGFLYVPNF